MVLTFSSDYGPTDAYVGICHLVIARIAPAVRVIDVVHGIKGVRSGAALLAQSLPFSPAGVHLAVVDPGVGTERRGVAIATAAGSVLVGPDNGLLTPAADALGGVSAVHELTDERFRLEPVSATFHGRDIFAPAAAYLASGLDPSELGPAVDGGALVKLAPPHVAVSDGSLESDVLFVDWYGNLELAATRDDLERSGVTGALVVSSGSVEHPATAGTTFADVTEGGLVVYVDSGERVAIARNGGSARDLLQDAGRVTLKRKL